MKRSPLLLKAQLVSGRMCARSTCRAQRQPTAQTESWPSSTASRLACSGRLKGTCPLTKPACSHPRARPPHLEEREAVVLLFKHFVNKPLHELPERWSPVLTDERLLTDDL
jgi:hypothetical protein